MSSIVPYVADLLALRRVPAQMFGTFTSINPVCAALAGWLLLHQALDLNEWIGIGLIVISNVVVSAGGFTWRRPHVHPGRQPLRHAVDDRYSTVTRLDRSKVEGLMLQQSTSDAMRRGCAV
jgi:inner membrane transporter RhtA